MYNKVLWRYKASLESLLLGLNEAYVCNHTLKMKRIEIVIYYIINKAKFI